VVGTPAGTGPLTAQARGDRRRQADTVHPPFLIPRGGNAIGTLVRLLIVSVALVPPLVVLLCSVPALVLWPFIPVTRTELPRRLDQLIAWTQLVLEAVLGNGTDRRPSRLTPGDVESMSPTAPTAPAVRNAAG
jgi:hypothetical protein